jgi:hypothetical protein
MLSSPPWNCVCFAIEVVTLPDSFVKPKFVLVMVCPVDLTTFLAGHLKHSRWDKNSGKLTIAVLESEYSRNTVRFNRYLPYM